MAKTDLQTLTRFGNATQRVERMPIITANKTSPPIVIPESGFWARLTEKHSTDNKYSFVAVEPQSDGTLDDNSAWREGDKDDSTGYAVQVQGANAGIDSIVWMIPAPAQSYFLFSEATPGYTWIIGTNDTAFTIANGTVDIKAVFPVLGGQSPLTDPEDTDEVLMVWNSFAHNGGSNSSVRCFWVADWDRWEIDLVSNCDPET